MFAQAASIRVMAPDNRLRSTRDRPAKPPLSVAAIVEAALAVTQSEGLAAVTMRRVAAELDTGAASLYVYVRNRDELLIAMLDRATSTIVLVAPDSQHWRAQVHDLLGDSLKALACYPGLAAALPVEPPTTEHTLAFVENLLGILLAGGITAQDAAWACDILNMIVTATASEADLRDAAGHTTDSYRNAAVQRMYATFSGQPPERYPNVVAHAGELVAGEGDDRFRFAVDTFLDGLVARSARYGS
jgi:AcrR family transcriptional regulator